MDVEKTIEFILDQQAHVAMLQSKMQEDLARREKIGERTDRRLDRAIRFAVREARAERKRRRELEAKLTASHAKLEASLNAFIDSMRRGGNGRQGNGE